MFSQATVLVDTWVPLTIHTWFPAETEAYSRLGEKFSGSQGKSK